MGRLSKAAARNDKEAVFRCLGRASPEEKRKALKSATMMGHPDIVALLLTGGAHPDPGLLIEAAHHRQAQIVGHLLVYGANCDDRGPGGMTALSKSAAIGEYEITEMLLEAGASVNTQSIRRFKPLDLAIKRGHTEVVRLLLDYGAEYSGSLCDSDKKHIWRNEELLKALMQGVSDDEEKGRALLYAAKAIYSAQILQVIIDVQSDLNVSAPDGKTALMYAAENGALEIVSALLDAGALINSECKAGMSALMYAANKSRWEVMRTLIERGANTEMLDNRGRAVWRFVRRGDNINKGEMEETLEMLRTAYTEETYLNVDWSYFPIATKFGVQLDVWNRVEKGVADKSISNQEGLKLLVGEQVFDLNATDKYWRNILMFAAYYGFAGIMGIFLNLKAKVHPQDMRGMSALTWATNGGHVDTVELLLRHHAPLNSYDRYERTALAHAMRHKNDEIARILARRGVNLYSARQMEGALTWACNNGNVLIVRQLLEMKMNPNESNQDGFTALMGASEKGQLECVKCLVNSRAEVNAKDRTGKAALWYAYRNGHVEVEIYLKTRNARLGTPEVEQSHLKLAVQRSRVEDVAEILNEATSDDWKKYDGFKALLYSIRERRWAIAKILAAKAGTALKAEEERTKESVLVVAVENGCPEELIGALIKRGAEKEGRNSAGETAFLVACRRGDHKGMWALWKLDANKFATDKDGNTALDNAIGNVSEKDEDRKAIIETLFGFGVECKLSQIEVQAFIEEYDSGGKSKKEDVTAMKIEVE